MDSRGTEDYASVDGHLVGQERLADNLRREGADTGVAFAAD